MAVVKELPGPAYAFHFRELTLEPRLGACGGSSRNARVHAAVTEVDLQLRLVRSLDTRVVTFDFGAAVGAAVFHQVFTTNGRGPNRTSLAGEGALGVGVTRSLGASFELSLLGEGGALRHARRGRERPWLTARHVRASWQRRAREVSIVIDGSDRNQLTTYLAQDPASVDDSFNVDDISLTLE